MAEGGWKVTFSIGIATFITLPDNVDEAIKASDQLMYEVKSNGKNSIAHEVFGRR
ncbi:MAG: diguanylate cyclase [Steroidobacteraceae bacterium]